MKRNNVYIYGEVLQADQPDIDFGYSPKRKSAVKDLRYHAYSVQMMEKRLDAVGATETVIIHPDSAIAFFYNSTEKVFGFYYAGKIQFVCPIENFVSFGYETDKPTFYNSSTTVSGVGFDLDGINSIGFASIPTLNVMPATSIWTLLLYKCDNEVKEFNMNFNACSKKITLTSDGSDILNVQIDNIMTLLTQNLKKIQMKLEALGNLSSDQGAKYLHVKEVDNNFFESKNKGYEHEYALYLQMIEKEGKKTNIKRILKRSIMIGAIIAGCGAIAVMAFLIFNGFAKTQ